MYKVANINYCPITSNVFFNHPLQNYQDIKIKHFPFDTFPILLTSPTAHSKMQRNFFSHICCFYFVIAISQFSLSLSLSFPLSLTHSQTHIHKHTHTRFPPLRNLPSVTSMSLSDTSEQSFKSRRHLKTEKNEGRFGTDLTKFYLISTSPDTSIFPSFMSTFLFLMIGIFLPQLVHFFKTYSNLE